jgi:YspA, cpYpsA-related SLOG family
MIVIVCGGRRWGEPAYGKSKSTIIGERQMLYYALHGRGITEIRHGGSTGADTYAGTWARGNGVFERQVDADWENRGRSAGPMRNAKMLAMDPKPDLVIAMPGGIGTRNMVNQALAAGVPVERVGWNE